MRATLLLLTLSSLVLTASATLTYASATIMVSKVVAELSSYGINAAYRGSVINVSLLVTTSEPIYNVSVVKSFNASLLKSSYLSGVSGSSILNASLLIPYEAVLGKLNVSLIIRYYTYPEPTEVCNESKEGIDLYVCAYTNISSTYHNELYVWTYPYLPKKLLIYRGSKLIANTSVTSWVRIKDPYAGATKYRFVVISYLGNASLKLITSEARPTKHYLTTSFIIRTIPKNVTKLNLSINLSTNSLIVKNPATLNDEGQLVIHDLRIKVYDGEVRNDTLVWSLNRTYVIRCLRANETKLIKLPWDLSKWPLINVTAEVCDDVHGCFIINRTYLIPLIQLCREVVFKVVDTHGMALPNALIVLNGVSVLTNEDGIAKLRTYPLGAAKISYLGRVTHKLVAGCGEYLVTMDLDPPKVINISSPEPGFLIIKAYDYSLMNVFINGYGPYGPFNNSITIYLPFIRADEVKVAIVDSFNNSVSLTVSFKPVKYGQINYLAIAEITIPLVIIAYVALALILPRE